MTISLLLLSEINILYKPNSRYRAILTCLFIALRALAARSATTAARPNTLALVGPLPAAAQLLRWTNHPSLSRVALCANCPTLNIQMPSLNVYVLLPVSYSGAFSGYILLVGLVILAFDLRLFDLKLGCELCVKQVTFLSFSGLL